MPVLKDLQPAVDNSDVAEQTHLSEIERLRLVIDTVRHINAVALQASDVMRVVCEHAEAVTGATGGIVELVEGDDMVCRAATGAARSALSFRRPWNTGLSGLCMTQGESFRCDEAELDPRVDRESCRDMGINSMIVVPVLRGGAPVGVLQVISDEPAHFDDADTEVLELMADFIADSLTTAHGRSELGFEAMRDSLTGLATRTLLMDRLSQAAHRARRRSAELAVLFIDLDGFTAVNDALGHATGDEVLQAVAARLSRSLRAEDTLARLRGDEFALVCENSDEKMIQAVEGRIEAAVAEVGAAFGVPELGVSIGVVRSSSSHLSPEKLLAAAEAAMSEARRRPV